MLSHGSPDESGECSGLQSLCHPLYVQNMLF